MLKIESVSKTFNPGTPDEKKALSSLSLTVEDGEFVSIIGANGAGKSTLFNAIGGSFLPDSGKIILGEEDITYQKENIRARRIGRLFQDPLSGTAPDMTILENLALAGLNGGWLSRITPAEKKRFREKLKELDMGLEERMNTPVRLLSGGQRQALTLLMATINPPEVLLLDEHTAALDPKTAAKVLEATDRVVEENKLTTLMVTHNMKDAINHGNRLIMMSDGRIIFDVSGEEKKKLKVADLLEKFEEAGGEVSDRMALS